MLVERVHQQQLERNQQMLMQQQQLASQMPKGKSPLVCERFDVLLIMT